MNVFLNLVYVKMVELVRTSAGVTNVTVQKEMPVTTVMEVSLSLSLSLSINYCVLFDLPFYLINCAKFKYN